MSAHAYTEDQLVEQPGQGVATLTPTLSQKVRKHWAKERERLEKEIAAMIRYRVAADVRRLKSSTPEMSAPPPVDVRSTTNEDGRPGDGVTRVLPPREQGSWTLPPGPLRTKGPRWQDDRTRIARRVLADAG